MIPPSSGSAQDQRGERETDSRTITSGVRVRALIRYGVLFGGSTIEGRVREVIGPRSPWYHDGAFRAGIPIRDPRDTVLVLDDYGIDGRYFGREYGRPDGSITLDDADIARLTLEGA